MTRASASPAFRTAAHRRAVMQHIGVTLPPTALGFVMLGPLIGCTLVWGSAFVALICQTVITPAMLPITLALLWHVLSTAYLTAAFPAAITGVWVALFSPFTQDRSRFLAGAAALGAATTFLFMALAAPIPGLIGGPLFLAIVGAVSAFVAAWVLQDITLKRDEARRDTLARDRADRLAKERASA
jgi:uncharacterized membrane protein (DUF485 family)